MQSILHKNKAMRQFAFLVFLQNLMKVIYFIIQIYNGQNYNQIDNYAPQQQPYNYQRPYQPDPYYNMNQYNQNNGYNAYPQDNDASYYYNYTPNSNNSDADSYDVSR